MRLNFNKFGLLSLAATAALAACTPESVEIPKEELYTRDFIKTFGLIDPNQNWNLVAQRAAKANSQSRNSIASRTVQPGNDLIKTDVLSGAHSYLTLSEEEIHSFEKYLPESNQTIAGGHFRYEDTNHGAKHVTNGFFVRGAEELWIFPQYWDTNAYYKNRMGIYYYVDGPADTNNNIFEKEITNSDGTTSTAYVQLVTIFDGTIEQLKQVDYSNVINTDASTLGKDAWASAYGSIGTYLSKLAELKPEKYKVENAGIHINTTNSGWKNAWDVDFTVDDIIEESASDLVAFFPDAFSMDADNKLIYTTGLQITQVTTPKDIKFAENGVRNLQSTGVHITIDPTISEAGYGFWLNQPQYPGGEITEERLFFSEKKLNKKVKFYNDERTECNDEREVTYVSTYVPTDEEDKYDSAGNEKRYLCFEDWQEDNFDLNDMVFRLYGIDKLRDDDEPGGEIIPDDPTDPEPTEDKLIEQGLLACEDLGVTDDIDFNDIVLKLEHYRKTTTEGDQTTTTDRLVITPMAAGGTLHSYVKYDTRPAPQKRWAKSTLCWTAQLPQSSTHTRVRTKAPARKS